MSRWKESFSTAKVIYERISNHTSAVASKISQSNERTSSVNSFMTGSWEKVHMRCIKNKAFPIAMKKQCGFWVIKSKRSSNKAVYLLSGYSKET